MYEQRCTQYSVFHGFAECTFSRRKRRNRSVERRGDARNDSCHQCSGACHRSGTVFCVRMLKNVELYASLQEDFAFFGERRKLQNEGWPQHTPWAVAYAHQEGARVNGACSRTPLAAVVASRRRRQRRQRFRCAIRRGTGRLLLGRGALNGDGCFP